MDEPIIPLHVTHIVGQDSREWVLGRERFNELALNHFVWVGHSEVLPPYRMVRLHSPYTHVVACFGGSGRVLINDELVDWVSGQVLLCPKGSAHAFEATGPEPCYLAWVFYDDKGEAPLVNGDSSRLVKADIAGFVSILKLLTNEAAGAADPAAMQYLASLLKIHTKRLGDENAVDARLVRLWEKVDARLGESWGMSKLSKSASMSAEHLRRLCRRDYGCTPMKRLTELRMHRACIRLRESSHKLEVISDEIGFSSVYHFCRVFKQWSGITPGEFRSKGG